STATATPPGLGTTCGLSVETRDAAGQLTVWSWGSLWVEVFVELTTRGLGFSLGIGRMPVDGSNAVHELDDMEAVT
ncbi:MAG: hypothetical protein LC749_22220, partial [Actinobacteria bacterium]|nr:hypothetical protein [Actinomycetota bacterium]